MANSNFTAITFQDMNSLSCCFSNTTSPNQPICPNKHMSTLYSWSFPHSGAGLSHSDLSSSLCTGQEELLFSLTKSKKSFACYKTERPVSSTTDGWEFRSFVTTISTIPFLPIFLSSLISLEIFLFICFASSFCIQIIQPFYFPGLSSFH